MRHRFFPTMCQRVMIRHAFQLVKSFLDIVVSIMTSLYKDISIKSFEGASKGRIHARACIWVICVYRGERACIYVGVYNVFQPFSWEKTIISYKVLPIAIKLASSWKNTMIYVRLNLSARLISYGTIFFSHNKIVSAALSAVKPSAEQPVTTLGWPDRLIGTQKSATRL